MQRFFLFSIVLIQFFMMGILCMFAQKKGFADQLKEAITAVEKEANKDPDTFKANMERLEREWGSQKGAVERSVVHALFGSAYREMKWTSISDYDEETRDDFDRKASEHYSHVLDDMELLADGKARDYMALLVKGKDSDLYGDDMLSPMLFFVLDHAVLADKEKVALEERAFEVYRKRGNMNAYAGLKLEWLNGKRGLAKKDGNLTDEQYRDSLYQLLQEVKGEEIGADVALKYQEALKDVDEKILFLQWAVENVAASRKKEDLKTNLERILRPNASVHDVNPLLADQPGRVGISYWNSDRVTLTVRQYAGRKSVKDGGGLKQTGDVVLTKEVVFETDADNAERRAKGLPVRGEAETELTLPVGHYVCVAEGLGDEGVQEFQVSTLHLMAQEISKEKWRIYVVNHETGRPIQGVKVQIRKSLPYGNDRTEGWENRDLVAEVLTGADGTVEVDKNMWIRAVRNEKDYTSYAHCYGSWRTFSDREEDVKARVMTDRSIYRPGQKVQGSVIVYAQKGDDVRVVSGDRLTLLVTTPRWKEVLRQELQTNEYGTASFEFVLPEDGEVGSWNLNVMGSSGCRVYEYVRVEEYKRPTFEVSFDGQRSGKFGQMVEAVGTAMMLAGVPVQGAQVHYTVECMPSVFRWWWYGGDDWNVVSEGDLRTDDEGQFKVPMFLTDEYLTGDRPLMRFRVKAQVTDVSGESHEATWSMNVSHRECSVEVTMEQSVVDLAQNAGFKVETFNANHEKVEMKGTYKIYYEERVLSEGAFVSGEQVLLPKTLKPGVHYGIEAVVEDSQGVEVKGSQWFTPYRSDMPVTDIRQLGTSAKRRQDDQQKELDFIYAPSDTYTVGGSLDVYFSTKETDAYIIYNVYGAEGLLESHVAVTDGSMKRLRLPYRKEWGEGMKVNIMYVRNGRFVSLERGFELAKPEKKLKLEWATFRDKLQPGQQEQWTLTVTDSKGRRVNGAEMTAVLYDAALDRIYSHYWSFYLSFGRFVPTVRKMDVSETLFPSFRLYGKLVEHKPYTRGYNQLKGFEHDRYLRRGERLLYSKAVLAEAAPSGELGDMVEDEELMLDMTSADMNGMQEGEAAKESEETQSEKADFDKATVRQDFSETAFFLSHLVSDGNGNVNIQFTLPESLTEWKFMGFAHTKDVDYGSIRATAMARKAFMLRPNMPRFVRWGDRAVIASSIVNQSEELLKGTVRLRLLDPKGGEVLLSLEKPFAVEAGKTTKVDFCFDVKEEWSDLDCEIIAVSGNVSDGEKNALPVLPTKMEIVESVPYYIMGTPESAEVVKTVDLTKLYNQNSATASHRALKVEYTDNPAWMCIEALRSVKNPEEDDAIDYAASLYANTRMMDLMRTFPIMEKYEHADELAQRVATADRKLADLQKNDGGWSWFEGMSSSYYITMAVCEHLAKFPAPTEHVKKMLADGMAYLDRHEWEAYKYAKKHRNVWPGNSELRYLYLSALMPERVVSKDIEKMREEYLSLVEKAPKDLTIYGVANAAYALRAFGHVKSSNKFVDFMKDYMVEKPGQGRFFATDAAYYSWLDYRIPTQVAAMKAIRQRDKNDAFLNDMQLWLMTQKQVQKWDNPMNTIDVVDFLLQVSPMETFHEARKPVLSVDGHVLEDMDYGTINTERDELEGRESHLVLQGNVLAEVPTEVLKEGTTQLEVKKQTPGISWGAAYATFMEDVGSLKSYATDELKVQRKLYVQRMGSQEWEEYQGELPLKVGDKLKIRHIITADRDMDFVRVSAQHPACLEPLRQLSGYQWMGGRGCYLSVHDAHFDMFFDWFTRGTATLDMEYYVVRNGEYEAGVSTVECMYAKQFGGHTNGLKLRVTADE